MNILSGKVESSFEAILVFTLAVVFSYFFSTK